MSKGNGQLLESYHLETQMCRASADAILNKPLPSAAQGCKRGTINAVAVHAVQLRRRQGWLAENAVCGRGSPRPLVALALQF